LFGSGSNKTEADIAVDIEDLAAAALPPRTN
jgi:hypothetical protein